MIAYVRIHDKSHAFTECTLHDDLHAMNQDSATLDLFETKSCWKDAAVLVYQIGSYERCNFVWSKSLQFDFGETKSNEVTFWSTKSSQSDF
jgi:hypothetical protein